MKKIFIIIGTVILIGIVLLFTFIYLSTSNKGSINTNNNQTTQQNNFFSKNLGYSLKVPNQWYFNSMSDSSLEFNNNIDDSDYIKNEDIGAPLEMSQSGIWMSINKFEITTDFSDFIVEQSEGKTIYDRTELEINNMDAVSQCEVPNYPTELGYDHFIYIDSGDYYFEITILSSNEKNYLNNKEKIDDILFSFNLENNIND